MSNKTHRGKNTCSVGIQLFKEQFRGFGEYSGGKTGRKWQWEPGSAEGRQGVNKVTKFMFLNRSKEIFRV